MFKDMMFGTAAWAIVAYGYTVLGPMDVEAWQAILLLGLGGWLGGYRCRIRREELRYIRVMYPGGQVLTYRGR